MRKLVIFIISVMCFTTLVFSVGCAKEPLEAKFKDEIDNAVCFYKEEFDLEPYVLKQEGVKYIVTAEQIDSESLETIDLKVDGFKFTPLLNEEVIVSFIAERGEERITSSEVNIFIEVKVDAIVTHLIEGWADDGISKSVNLDEQYIKSDNKTSLSVKWAGMEPSDKDRFQYIYSLIGDEITDCYSVTDWTNAVLSFWVYNPTEYEIEFAPIWSHNDWVTYLYGDDEMIDVNVSLYYDMRTIQVAEPKAWTEIKYSLRYYGMTHNFFYDDEIYHSYYGSQVAYGSGYDSEIKKYRINQNFWTCRWGGRERKGIFYSYNFYVDGFDIRNYDAAKDSDLDIEYRGFWNQPIMAGSNADIVVARNDGKTLTFEYKITSGEQFGVALIEENMGENYFGYFNFNKDGALDEYLGVTVTDIGDGYKKVVFDLKTINVMVGTTRPTVIKKIFVRDIYNNANFVIRNAN